MRKFVCLFFILGLSLTLVVGCSKTDVNTGGTDSAISDDIQLLEGKHSAQITIGEYGEIEVELDADTAPITVTNFVNLAEQGFYDGLTFHRIIEGFMIQGGSPNGDGVGGAPSGTIQGEFEANGIPNDILHERGILSMARSGDMDSASSQFFIMHADAPHLDKQYAAFGRVTKGMDVVDQIGQSTPIQDVNGTVLPADQPIIESIRLLP